LPPSIEEKEKFNLKEELKKVSEFLEVLGGKKFNFCFEIAQREGSEEIEFFVALPKNQIEFFKGELKISNAEIRSDKIWLALALF